MLDGTVDHFILWGPETQQINLSINLDGPLSVHKCLTRLCFIDFHSVYPLDLDAESNFLYQLLMKTLDHFFLEKVVHVTELLWLQDKLILDGEEFEHK